jgi:hypothetical protein
VVRRHVVSVADLSSTKDARSPSAGLVAGNGAEASNTVTNSPPWPFFSDDPAP